MELCRKMDSSHYYAGLTDTNQLYNTNSDKNNASNNDIQMNYSDDDFTKTSSSHNNRPCMQNNEYNIADPGYNLWNNDVVECKQEMDTSVKTNNDTNTNNNNINNNINNVKNYNMEEEYNKPFPYFHSYYNSSSYFNNYKNTHSTPSNLLHHNHYQQRPEPYRVSAIKNQMPSWYPSSINKQHFSQKNQLNQQQSYKTSYLSSSLTSPETEVPTSPPEHMRNMIHLTNRNGREARNRAEKHRRDKLNGSIQELSTMVPHVAESPRRVDKTAVLRFSAHGLRIDYVFGQENSSRFLVNPKSTEGLMKLLDTFLLTVTCRGNIVLVSNTVEQYLGHCKADLYGQSLLNITHPDDHTFLKQQLIPTDLHDLFMTKTDEHGEPRSRTEEEEDEIDKKLREDRRDFTIRVARAGPRSEPTSYEMVRIDGCFRRADSAPRGRPTTGPTGLQLIRRARGRDENIPLHSISGNDIILIAMARVMKAPMFCDRLIESCKYEYKTRHLIDGRIVQCDQRISIVAGYLTEEVSGLSPFTFMHKSDVRWVMVALRQMYDLSQPFGESCYRLMSRTGQFIYLKTRGYLEVDEQTHQVHSFMCINTLVPEDEGRKLVREMKKKFSAIISQAELNALESDIPAVENPQILERAILNLITNLNTASHDDDNASMISDSTVENDDPRSTKTPPLNIVAPKRNTVATSITKSARIIKSASTSTSQSEIKDEPQSPSEIVPHLSVLNTAHQSSPNAQLMSIKVEPNILSPTSSLSSFDSDNNCSPFISNSQMHNLPVVDANFYSNQNLSSLIPNSSTTANHDNGDFSTPYDNIPLYDIDANPPPLQPTIAKPSGSYHEQQQLLNINNYTRNDSAINAANNLINTSNNNNNNNINNNNKNNINRNSVLKRVHSRDVSDEYSQMCKKPTTFSTYNELNDVSTTPPLELLSNEMTRVDCDDLSDVVLPSSLNEVLNNTTATATTTITSNLSSTFSNYSILSTSYDRLEDINEVHHEHEDGEDEEDSEYFQDQLNSPPTCSQLHGTSTNKQKTLSEMVDSKR